MLDQIQAKKKFFTFLPSLKLNFNKQGVLNNCGGPNNPGSVKFRMNENKILAGVSTILDDLSSIYQAEITCGEWHHIALVYDDEKLFFYVDNVDRSTNVVGRGPIDMRNHCPLTICNDPVFGNLKGMVDQVVFIKAALTPAQITQLYNEQIP